MSDVHKELGICVVCGKRLAEPGRVSCIECLSRGRIKKAEKHKKMTEEERKEKNQQINKLHRELYKKRKDAGVCTRCGKRKPMSGRPICIECHARATRNRKTKIDGIPRSEYPNYGLCYFCGAPTYKDFKECKSCYERLERMRERKREGHVGQGRCDLVGKPG